MCFWIFGKFSIYFGYEKRLFKILNICLEEYYHMPKNLKEYYMPKSEKRTVVSPSVHA